MTISVSKVDDIMPPTIGTAMRCIRAAQPQARNGAFAGGLSQLPRSACHVMTPR